MEMYKRIIRKNTLCVLATCAEESPHCSLMLYCINEECTSLYMATLKNTRKYVNICKNPSVSILVDTRTTCVDSEFPMDLQAVTLGCHATELEGQQRGQVLTLLMTTHPQLIELGDASDIAVFEMHIRNVQILAGVNSVQNL